MTDRKSLLWFLVITFVWSWPLFVLPLAFGEPGSPTRQVVTLIAWSAAMWGPGLAALLTTRFVARQPLATLHLRRLGPKWPYFWAWLLPPSLALVTGLLTLAFGLGQLDLSFTAIRESMAQAPGGEGVNAWLVVGIQLALAFTIGPLFNLPFALGEELGWRGFLLPHLLPLGQWRAILVSGAIWGVWHAPAILQGHNYPGYPIPGMFMMTVFCVLLSAILSWLYLETRSPWAPALAHASLNASAGLSLLFLKDVNPALAGLITSPVGWISLAACVAWLVWRRRLTLPGARLETAGIRTSV